MSGCPDCEARSRWRWWLVAGVAVTALVLLAELAGCGSRVMTIGALQPTPRLVLPKESSSLALNLGRTASRFRVDSDGFPTVEVRDFDRTLRAAFERGFGSSFAHGEAGRADRTLVVQVTRLAFVTTPDQTSSRAVAHEGATIVLVHGTPSARHQQAPRRHMYAQLTFRAALRDSTGEIAHFSANAHSTAAAEASHDGVSRGIASAVANLYEQIGRELFLRHTASLGVLR